MSYNYLGQKKKLWMIISGLLMVPAVFALVYWGLPLGIDFRGGAQLELKFATEQQQSELKEKISSYPEARGVTITETEGGAFIIRILPISEEDHKKILTQVRDDFGEFTEQQFQSVGPSVSRDLTQKAVIAVVIASLLIVLYLTYSFRGVSYPVNSWRFGVVAIIALLHDLVIAVGIFAILAHFLGYEVDSSFITAVLTIMGFSVHDTIVVFDRIRENLSKSGSVTSDEFEQIADRSIAETLNRSIATSLTVLFTLTALLLIGGESIRGFIATLLVGILVGTYSSIFTATPLLVIWQQWLTRKLTK